MTIILIIAAVVVVGAIIAFFVMKGRKGGGAGDGEQAGFEAAPAASPGAPSAPPAAPVGCISRTAERTSRTAERSSRCARGRAAERTSRRATSSSGSARTTERVGVTHRRGAGSERAGPPGASSHASSATRGSVVKPTSVWDPSQNGLVFEWPQRHSLIRTPRWSGLRLRSSSCIAIDVEHSNGSVDLQRAVRPDVDLHL
jgi:hypothetical protein